MSPEKNRRKLLTAAGVTALAGIWGFPGTLMTGALAASPAASTRLVDPTISLGRWKRTDGRPATQWTRGQVDGVSAIKARAEGAVGILHRDVGAALADNAKLRWAWRVDDLPRSADLSSEDADDLAAGIALVFGKVGLFKNPLTLVYAWTSEMSAANDIVPCIRHPEHMRFVVVRSGEQNLGQWLDEERDVQADFLRAFGHVAPAMIDSVALWSDSDQTGETSEAAFGAADLAR